MKEPESLHVKTGTQNLILHLNEYCWTMSCLSILHLPLYWTGRAPSEQQVREERITPTFLRVELFTSVSN